MPCGQPTGLPPAGLTAAQGLATLRAHIVFLFYHIVRLTLELTCFGCRRRKEHVCVMEGCLGTGNERLRRGRNHGRQSDEVEQRGEARRRHFRPELQEALLRAGNDGHPGRLRVDSAINRPGS
jgi:hypothetical protein